MAVFTDTEIREYSFAAVLDQGQQLFSRKCVVSCTFIGNDIIALVKGKIDYQVIISRDGNRLHFTCNCGYSHVGACEHAVAVMLAANVESAIQIGIKWDDLIDDESGCYGGENEDARPDESSEILEEDLPEEAAVFITDHPPEKPLVRFYLSEQEGMLLAELRFAYYDGRIEFTRSNTAPSRLLSTAEGSIIRVSRSRARETMISGALASFELEQYKTGFYTPCIDPRIWTLQQLPLLAAEGYEIYGQEQLQSTQARKTTPKLAVSVSSGVSIINCSFSVSFDGIPATLAALIDAVKQKSRFILLTDGSSGMMPEEWLDMFAALFSALKESDIEEDRVKLRSSQLGLAEALCELADDQSTDTHFKQKLERLHSGFKEIGSIALPDGFNATLRPYQQAGYEWFHFLREYCFGGCLADDMGLGKTIQTLALLLGEKMDGKKQPSLIIVPNSLLFNWQREAKKFAPDLKILIYHGNTRHNYSDILNMADVVLTTYGTIIRDIDHLQKLYFHYAILDEAQAIKNPSSQISKAVRLLRCGFRLALSGTPIENNLSELWSMFTFLNPGMLGSYKTFLNNFIKPIEREDNELTTNLLRKIIFPFILRRTKSQVVKELPPKNEIVVYADMLPPQRKLYDITRELYYGKIMRSIDLVGIEKSRMELLEGLLRMRQICCHPQLFEPAYNNDSGKFQIVEEMVQDAVSEGHRVLLFSQFVSALQLLRERFLCYGISCELLTGATRDRQKVVDRFQSGKGASVFLISLKAGGTGLNLTSADYVFHLDPWWNPSAENQASDRAYRIGQTKTVFVYKMITRDSIEERVLELQQKKQNLMNSIIHTEGSFFKQLDREHIRWLFE